jgi:hypothetical protein
MVLMSYLTKYGYTSGFEDTIFYTVLPYKEYSVHSEYKLQALEQWDNTEQNVVA